MTTEQVDYICTTFKGCKLDDIACGHSPLKHKSRVFDYLGIDKEVIPGTITADLSKPCQHLRYDVALVSWPINRLGIAWHLFLDKYPEIVYVGCNTGGIMCGDPEFWKIVTNREVLHIVPDRSETLIHYGPKSRPAGARQPMEEYYGQIAWNGGKIHQYDEKLQWRKP